MCVVSFLVLTTVGSKRLIKVIQFRGRSWNAPCFTAEPPEGTSDYCPHGLAESIIKAPSESAGKER